MKNYNPWEKPGQNSDRIANQKKAMLGMQVERDE